MSYVRPTCTALLPLLTLGLAACAGAPPTPDAGPAVAPPVAEAPAPARSPASAAGGASDAEAPEQVVPAVQLAYALVPPDSKSLAPGHGTEEYRIDLPTITFEFDSAMLTPQGRTQLDELAEALAYETAVPYRFRLAGHTDTAGPDELNRALSLARAEAARNYLIREHGVDPARLEVEGHGENDLAWPTEDEVVQWRNRRVEVVNLGVAG